MGPVVASAIEQRSLSALIPYAKNRPHPLAHPSLADPRNALEQASHGAVQVKGPHQVSIDKPPVASASQV